MSVEKILKDVITSYMDKSEKSNAFEDHMKNVLQTYIDSINKKDPDTLLGLLADNIYGEDPVGTKPIVGLKNIEPMIRYGMSAMQKVELVAPIRTCTGNSAAMAFKLYMSMEGKNVTIDVIDVMDFNESGKIVKNMAYWGKDNLTVID